MHEIGLKEKYHIDDALIPFPDRDDKVCFRCGETRSVKYKSRYQYGEFYLCNKCMALGGASFINGLHNELSLLKSL